MTFQVDRTPSVNLQMRELANRAKARRIHDAYAGALRHMLERLRNDPLEWGDPEYNAQHSGGVFCHAIVWPLFVRFTVYQNEQVVIIFDITPLPTSPLADP